MCMGWMMPVARRLAALGAGGSDDEGLCSASASSSSSSARCDGSARRPIGGRPVGRLPLLEPSLAPAERFKCAIAGPFLPSAAPSWPAASSSWPSAALGLVPERFILVGLLAFTLEATFFQCLGVALGESMPSASSSGMPIVSADCAPGSSPFSPFPGAFFLVGVSFSADARCFWDSSNCLESCSSRSASCLVARDASVSHASIFILSSKFSTLSSYTCLSSASFSAVKD
mmetsp:Transcript_95208/g.168564  ORF Transcript_95208/g.168564 Transcript_95208/m.168564 type:complete len:230 (+) Transcript_95208:2120-2809(+)